MLRIILAGLLLAWPLATTQAQPASVRLTELAPIPLRIGVNRVQRFARDGREAQIVLGWRDNGNAHSYDLFLVLMPLRPGGSDWNVVGVEHEADRFEDVIRDQPHTGEDMVRSIRFAHGRLNGTPETLLLTATREMSPEGIPAPSAVVFEVFRLVASDGVPGTTRDYFERVARMRGATLFCNAEVALSRAFGLPPRGAAGAPRTPDGCPR